MTTLRQRRRGNDEERYGLGDLAQWIKAGNVTFPVGLNTTYGGSPGEVIGDNFADYVRRIYKRNGIVAATLAGLTTLPSSSIRS